MEFGLVPTEQITRRRRGRSRPLLSSFKTFDLRRLKWKRYSRFEQKDLRGPAGNAVYVGRPSIWGNPFVIGKDGSRAEVIEKYETWLMSQPQLLSKLHGLRGKNFFVRGARRRLVMPTCLARGLRIKSAR